MSGIKKFEEFLVEKKEKDAKYQAFFKKALAKFKVEDPGELSGEKEKEFYDYVDDNWESEKEDKYDDDESKGGGKK